MKRRLVTILIVLTLGSILNVAVAWGFHLWGYRPPRSIDSVPLWANRPAEVSDLAIWRLRSAPDWPVEPSTSSRYTSPGLTLDKYINIVGMFDPAGLPPEQFDALMARRHSFWIERSRCGWPMRCLSVDVWSHMHGTAHVLYATNALRVRTSPVLDLPSRVHAVGTIVNTVVYAALLWVLYSTPFGLRRIIRRKRGHCIKCGYDLRGDLDAGCPECGWNREAEVST